MPDKIQTAAIASRVRFRDDLRATVEDTVQKSGTDLTIREKRDLRQMLYYEMWELAGKRL